MKSLNEKDETLFPILSKYALKLAEDPKIQNNIRDLVNNIVGNSLDRAFGVVNNELDIPNTIAPDSYEDVGAKWEEYDRKHKIQNDEESKEFVTDYISTSVVNYTADQTEQEVKPSTLDKLKKKSKGIFDKFMKWMNEDDKTIDDLILMLNENENQIYMIPTFEEFLLEQKQNKLK